MEKEKQNKINNNLLIIVAIIVVGAIAGYHYFNPNSSNPNNPGENNTQNATTLANKVLAAVNENIKNSGQEGEATVANVSSAISFYKFDLVYQGKNYPTYVSADGKKFFYGSALISLDVPGGFSEKEDATVCEENGKPIIYFFGMETCAHCQWEKPIIEDVASKFGDKISFHENIDSPNDQDVFAQYSSGGVPTLVLGCKYYREGAGEAMGEEKERQALTELICKLTNNQPADVCNQ